MRKSSLMIVMVLLCSIGCATTGDWKSKSVTTYESTAVVLKSIHDTAKPMCDSGQISAENCGKIKNLYTKARSATLVAGDALKIAINTEDAITQKASLQVYQKAITDVATFLPELMALAHELGIKKEAQNGGN